MARRSSFLATLAPLILALVATVALGGEPSNTPPPPVAEARSATVQPAATPQADRDLQAIKSNQAPKSKPVAKPKQGTKTPKGSPAHSTGAPSATRPAGKAATAPAAPTSPAPAPGVAEGPLNRDLTLEDTIRIAVSDNLRVKNAYLDRVVQKYDLYVAESKFTPKFVITTDLGA